MGLEKAQKITHKSTESQGNGVSSALLICAVRTYLPPRYLADVLTGTMHVSGGPPDRKSLCRVGQVTPDTTRLGFELGHYPDLGVIREQEHERRFNRLYE